MVFPSLPVYHLDPSNWAQQQHDQLPGGVIPTQNSRVPTPSRPPPPPTVAAAVGGGGSSTRPGSMADRARLAKIAQPEAAMKCPRCESTNTKFCYYNNYSLSQPRHFCKTCRRYWTRGGALRNVPVGGGCRRKNKRTKGSGRSKSPTKAVTSGSISNSAGANNNNSSTSCCPRSDHHLMAHLPPHLLFPTSSSLSYSDYDVVSGGINGLQFGATNAKNVDFQVGSSGSGGIIGDNNNGLITTEQWKPPSSQHHQQFVSTFLTTNLEAPIGLYQFGRSENVNVEPSRTLLYSGGSGISGTIDHLATTAKMDENIQVVGLANSVVGNSANSEQFWDANSGIGNAWNDNNIPSFACSSTSHLL